MHPLIWYAISVALVVADQATKWFANTRLDYGQPVPLWSWFNLNLAYNKGAAWSFLSDAGGWQRWFFIALSTGVSVVLVVWIWRQARQDTLLACCLALILGGAIGNLIDRIYFGHVIDFIQWHYAGFYWPTFNIADVAITIGAVLMVLHSFKAPQPVAEH